jgi:hypothetical protein
MYTWRRVHSSKSEKNYNYGFIGLEIERKGIFDGVGRQCQNHAVFDMSLPFGRCH